MYYNLITQCTINNLMFKIVLKQYYFVSYTEVHSTFDDKRLKGIIITIIDILGNIYWKAI